MLGRVADWRDLPAWRELFARYDPCLRRWCCGYGLDEPAVEEVCQRVWIELANRLRTFRYDPARTFRGWLREICRSRVIDLKRQAERERRNARPLDHEPPAHDSSPGVGTGQDEPEEPERPQSLLMREAALAQAAVRQRVGAKTWEAYWKIAIEEMSVREAAAELGMSYAAAFAAYTRVHQKLRAEGTKRLPALLGTAQPATS